MSVTETNQTIILVDMSVTETKSDNRGSRHVGDRDQVRQSG